MGVARLVGDDEKGAAHPQAHLDEPRVHGREREQGRHRRAVAARLGVAQAEERVAGGDRRDREDDDPVERRRRPFLLRERRVEDARLEGVDPVRVEQEPRENRQGRQRPGATSDGERAPSSVDTDMTRRSRRWSIAGFVTCAKRWRR